MLRDHAKKIRVKSSHSSSLGSSSISAQTVTATKTRLYYFKNLLAFPHTGYREGSRESAVRVRIQVWVGGGFWGRRGGGGRCGGGRRATDTEDTTTAKTTASATAATGTFSNFFMRDTDVIFRVPTGCEESLSLRQPQWHERQRIPSDLQIRRTGPAGSGRESAADSISTQGGSDKE